MRWLLLGFAVMVALVAVVGLAWSVRRRAAVLGDDLAQLWARVRAARADAHPEVPAHPRRRVP